MSFGAAAADADDGDDDDLFSALTLQDPDVSFLGEVHGTTSSDELTAPSAQMAPHNSTSDGTPPLGCCYSASSGPTIWHRRPKDWYFTFFIRMDRGGAFHMYPDLGGPFQSLKEADGAIDRYIDNLPRHAMFNEQDDISLVERLIRRSVFYPDGTPRRGPNARKYPKDFHQRHLLQAILDQYNDDHNLVGDLAHELTGDVTFKLICEDSGNYYHFNFTTKVKEAGDVYSDACNLFFAEVVQIRSGGDWVVSCCCMIKPNDDGYCIGCPMFIKHPKSAHAYTGGHEEDTRGFGGLCSDPDDDDIALLRIRLKGVFRDGASGGAGGAQATHTAGEPMKAPQAPKGGGRRG